jgi:hypothetical protein
MATKNSRRIRLLGTLLVFLLLPARTFGQTGQVSGYVRDSSGQVLASATVLATNVDTGQARVTRTGTYGLYVLASLPPGRYDLAFDAPGFQRATLPLQIEVGQLAGLDVKLRLAGVNETVAVAAEPPLLGSRDGAVGSVIDRRFAENIPLSGRTFQALLELTPGVVRAPGGGYAASGQRTSANYFQVDGVSGQTAVGATSFAGAGVGQRPTTVATGGFTGLSSVDALQEFRVQTSNVAPEYGRGLGAQVSIVTRSGTNTLQGSAFDYIRNDALDANNWFVNYRGLRKQELRQQDFGGVLGGPIVSSRLFYFGSYEGLRVRQPRVLSANVPSAAAREAAVPALRPLLDAFPQPTGPDAGLVAEYSAGVTNEISADAVSGRLDFHQSGLQLFARYNHAPSSTETPSAGYVLKYAPRMDSLTMGATYIVGPKTLADLRANYTSSSGPLSYESIATPGSVPLPDSAFPPVESVADTLFIPVIGSASSLLGPTAANKLTQADVTGTMTVSLATHLVKFGVNYRHLSSAFRYVPLQVAAIFSSLDDLRRGQGLLALSQSDQTTAGFHSLSLFAQDAWHVAPRVTLTYGLRWEVNPAPSFTSGHEPLAAMHFDDISQLDFAARGTSLWKTRYGNVAPRLGLAYDLDGTGRTVLTGGIGRFYDLGTQSSGSLIAPSNYPVTFTRIRPGVSFPLAASDVAIVPQPAIVPPYPATLVYLVDPSQRTPYAVQWNARIERQLGGSQSISVAYVGSRGEDLVSTRSVRMPNSRFPIGTVRLLSSDAESRYQSLQVQYRRRVSKGIEAQLGYTLSRSRDNASDDAFVQTPGGTASDDDMGPSNFDARHVFSGAVTWLLPQPRAGRFVAALFGGWSIDALARARSAFPVPLRAGRDTLNLGDSFATRPDVVPGVPQWIDDAGAPAGRRLNPAAFSAPPVGRQGTLGRNSVRGFNAAQVDFGLRRTIALHARVRLQVGADVFNLLNHATFADPDPDLTSATFGRAVQTYNVGGSAISGDLNSLYQWGGPRSVQVGMKLLF